MTDDEQKFREDCQRQSVKDDRAIAGDIFPDCPCFKNEAVEVRCLNLAGNMGDQMARFILMGNVCPTAIPYFLAQAISICIAKAAVATVGAEAEDRGDNDETILRACEDAMAEMAAKTAFVMPKLIAQHAVSVRHQTAMLGEMAVAATRRDTV